MSLIKSRAFSGRRSGFFDVRFSAAFEKTQAVSVGMVRFFEECRYMPGGVFVAWFCSWVANQIKVGTLAERNLQARRRPQNWGESLGVGALGVFSGVLSICRSETLVFCICGIFVIARGHGSDPAAKTAICWSAQTHRKSSDL